MTKEELIDENSGLKEGLCRLKDVIDDLLDDDEGIDDVDSEDDDDGDDEVE